MNGDSSFMNPLFILPSERLVEINSALNGVEGPKVREFAFKVENARKKIYAQLQETSEEDVLLKEIDQYIDGMLMQKNSESKGKIGFPGVHQDPSKAINHFARDEDMKNVPFGNDMVPEDQLEFRQIRKDLAQIASFFKVPGKGSEFDGKELTRNGK